MIIIAVPIWGPVKCLLLSKRLSASGLAKGAPRGDKLRGD